MIRRLGLAALIASVLDMGANFLLWGLWKGISPVRICQVVASGLYGKAAFDGGYVTALAGLALEYVIVLGMAAGYHVMILLVPWTRRHWGVAVVAYGLFLYIVMNYAVVPLSAAGRPYPWPIVWDVKLAFNLFCHIVLVVLPFALILRRDASKR
ncbi:hypothetical protein [Asticcacaulis solisilvae]|uniref:hypothetical protein n=1 Tax=Asticcacaulis solisilvae TaxID=1217274 RepID=UPI003FD72974